MEGSPPARLPTALAAGAMLVAGVLHLLLVPDHFAHARGAGLFFLGLGAAQAIWAFIFFRTPTPNLARIGLIALVLAPIVLYVLTRIWRAPWSSVPEAVDVIGVATQLIQLVAGAALASQWGPSLPERAPAALGVGILLAVGGYAGAIASEDLTWLAEAEAPHLHDGGHDGHDHISGTRGLNIVGSVEYYGPPTGAAIARECLAIGQENAGCWIHHLKHMLDAKGAVVAFDALVELLETSATANNRGHELAHLLGHHAYGAYGLDIALTLGECSYEVFQGCIHGALQMYFNDLAAQGKAIDRSTLNTVCSSSKTSFETYACLHGVGHGIMMHTNYALHDSLDMCYLLIGSFAQESCYGGVFMENVVAYKDSRDPNHQAHDHGHGEPPEFWVSDTDLAYPCNVIKSRYQDQCWQMQTSLILYFNGGDFEEASRICDGAGANIKSCYKSLGRDAPPFAKRDPAVMSTMCSYGAWEYQVVCVEAFTAGIILNANSPEAGMDLCTKLATDYQSPCYRKTGVQARSMLPQADASALCDRAPEEFVAVCHGRA